MTPNKLDRLSSLLTGLAPRVVVTGAAAKGCTHAFAACEGPSLRLHILDGTVVEMRRGTQTQTLAGPAYWIGQSDVGHTLTSRCTSDLDRVLTLTVYLEGPLASLLLGEFASPVLVRLGDADLILAPIISLVHNEMHERRCAMPALLNHAGNILFIGVLRHLVTQSENRSGLFCGLADPRIASSLVAMHESPQLAWTLETLAHHAGMSRTAFALRFKSALQRTPGKYLTALRLQIAHRTVQSGQGLKAAAHAAGYANVSALSRALGKKPVTP